jgi:excisionase family DNA binding protein
VPQEPLLTVADVVALLNVKPWFVYQNLVRRRTLPVVRVGGVLRFRRADVDAYIAQHTTPAAEGDGHATTDRVA